MNFRQRFWETYDGGLLHQELVDQLPANQGGIDRRSFEWFYWQRKMHSGHITLTWHHSEVQSVAFSPDGKRITSASGDGTVKVWDAMTGQETLTLKGHVGIVSSAAFSPDGQWIASAGQDRSAKLWDARPQDSAISTASPTSR